MTNLIKRLFFNLILISLVSSNILWAQEVDSPFYPDLQFSGNILVAGNELSEGETVVLRSVSAVKKEGGKCAVVIEYEIYNKGAISINQRFFSAIEVNGPADTSRLVNGIGPNEKKNITTAIWLNPNETTDIRIVLDNFNNVKEVSEDNNTKDFKILLKGNCETDEELNIIEENNKKGLFKKFEYRK